MSTLYSVSNLGFQYQLGNQPVIALRDVTFDVAQKSFLALTGPSGSGKSTLLNVLGLIEPVQSGDVRFSGTELKNLAEDQKNKIRRFKIGFIFQSFHLFPVLTAEENVEYFLFKQGLKPSERRARTRIALEAVGLWDHKIKKPLQMSGGQRQRVAIARAIAKTPEVIIADEPTANLDQSTGREIMKIFSELNKNQGTTIIVSSHDPMVKDYCSSSLRLNDGTLA